MGPQWATPGIPSDQPSYRDAYLEPGAETAVDFAVIDASSFTGVSVIAAASNANDPCMIWGDKTGDATVEAMCDRALFTYFAVAPYHADLWSTYVVNGDTTCGCYFWRKWDFITPIVDKESFYVTLDCDGLLPLGDGNYEGFLDSQAGSSSSPASPASTTILHVRNDNAFPVTVYVATGPTWSTLGSDACSGKEETPPGCVLYLDPGQDSGPAITLSDTTLVSLAAVGGPDSSSAKVWGQAVDLTNASEFYRCGVSFIPDTGNHEPYAYISWADTQLGCYRYFMVSAVPAAQPPPNGTTLVMLPSLLST
ncbi:hypothetical protein ACK3TF_003015 [Chlorella vulgaris]